MYLMIIRLRVLFLLTTVILGRKTAGNQLKGDIVMSQCGIKISMLRHWGKMDRSVNELY